jgi:diaminohydroxyphosphoribosylaminopyrimidine deaminase/5-amino-6-(5-phosphoribosylamino)uracil reductase
VARAGTLFVAAQGAPRSAEERLRATGAEVLRIAGARGRVAMRALLGALGRRGVRDLLVEGGAEVHGALLAAGLVDRVALFVAPILLGAGGVPLSLLPGAGSVAAAPRLSRVSTKRLGDDILWIGFLDGTDRRAG